MANRRFTRLCGGLLAIAAIALSGPIAYGDQFFDNGGNDGLWTTPTNWELDTVPVAEQAAIYLVDEINALPLVGGIPTVTLSSGVQSITAFKLGQKNAADPGDIQLLVTGTAVLNLTADSNVGNGDSATGPQNYTSYLRQEGGTISQTGGTGVDVKLSASGAAFRPAGVFSIAGGTFTTTGTITLGGTGTVNQAGPAILEVDGSGATLIQTQDLKTENAGAVAIWRSIIDAGGITPVIVTDELQMESLSFQLALSAVPPVGDIILANADRISNDNQFVGLPDGSDVSAPFGPNLYTWTINYFDSGSDGVIIPAIVLSDLRVSPVPEPATFALLGLGGLAMLAVRRRR